MRLWVSKDLEDFVDIWIVQPEWNEFRLRFEFENRVTEDDRITLCEEVFTKLADFSLDEGECVEIDVEQIKFRKRK
jgi:hypothetical protein